MPPDNHSFSIFYILSGRSLLFLLSDLPLKQKMMRENAYRRRRHFLFFMEFLQLWFSTLFLLSRLQHQAGFPSQRATSFAAAFAARHTYRFEVIIIEHSRGASPVDAHALAHTGMFVLLSPFSEAKALFAAPFAARHASRLLSVNALAVESRHARVLLHVLCGGLSPPGIRTASRLLIAYSLFLLKS